MVIHQPLEHPKIGVETRWYRWSKRIVAGVRRRHCWSYNGGRGGGLVAATAVVHKYIAAEIIELAGNAARRARRDIKKPRTPPRHLQLAELNKLVGGVTVAAGGAPPNFHVALLLIVAPILHA